jgi:hypothetical protein
VVEFLNWIALALLVVALVSLAVLSLAVLEIWGLSRLISYLGRRQPRR